MLDFSKSGDQYCGQNLAELDPHSSIFETLPPHFTVEMENEFINDAMHRCFPSNLEKRCKETKGNVMGVLFQCLASMTHHSSAILSVLKEYPSNSLLQIPILNESKLLDNLLPLVTSGPSKKIQAPTGIPPHVKLLTKLADLLNLFQDKKSTAQNASFTI